jgi:osmotically-inducible protein OsmY
MLGSLLRAVVLIVILVGAATFLLGWWGAGGFRSVGSPGGAVGTTGANAERAREVGAAVGERTAEAADQARRALNNSGITAKIKAKMALDDNVKALDINVDTSGSTVTVSGTVGSNAQRERVLRLARETDGVTQVVDRLTVR